MFRKQSIQSTKDYSIFKIHHLNDKVEKNNLKRLEDSVLKNNMLFAKPIIVNQNMFILDGLHRFTVARDNNLEIYYLIVETGPELTDAMVIQETNRAQRTHKLHRYLETQVFIGNVNYIKLQNFMEEHELPLITAIAFLKTVDTGGAFYENFKDGKFQFPEKVLFSKIEDTFTKIKTVQEFLHKKEGYKKITLNSSALVRALNVFLNKREVSFSSFMNKLEYNLNKFRRCSNMNDYLEILEEIYSWRSRNKLIDKKRR